MPYLEIRGQRHPIGVGEVAVGCDKASQVVLGGEDLHSKCAMLQCSRDGEVAIKRADPDADILINGVRLGPQPTPLLHGDKIGVFGEEVSFVDDRRSGSTEYIKAIDPGMLGAPSKPASQGKATAGTGGRLVSLTDGREYEITGGSLLIGRDAGCDVVISAKNVSRRHSEIVATPRGYILIDNSTNGTLVNGERMEGQHLLARADVVRCGDHEFRFYADAAPAEPETPAPSQPPVAEAPPPPPPPPPPAPQSPPPPMPSPPPAEPKESAPAPAPPPPPPAPAQGAEQRLAHTMHGIPAMPRPGTQTPPGGAPPPPPPGQGPGPAEGAEQRLAHTMHGIPAMQRPGATPPPPMPPAMKPSAMPEALASLLVRSGSCKGQRIPIRVPIVNIGRAEYNDIVLPDDSVSTVHAKLQRREGIWVLVDLESTNGTMVDGERVEGEAPLAPGAIVRFGTIQTIFEPTDDSIESQAGGGTQVLGRVNIPPQGDPPSKGSGG